MTFDAKNEHAIKVSKYRDSKSVFIIHHILSLLQHFPPIFRQRNPKVIFAFIALLLLEEGLQTFMDLTRFAVVLATSLADWTNCLLATALGVFEEARRQALHSAEVCLATMVAAESTWTERKYSEHD